MSLIKPSFVESQFHTFFRLEPDRMMYYGSVFALARSIFLMLGFNNKADELQLMIEEKIEFPLRSKLFSILQAYYNPRFIFSKLAYCKVGSGVDTEYVTRYQMTGVLEEIKQWTYDEVTNLTPYIRFTRPNEITG